MEEENGIREKWQALRTWALEEHGNIRRELMGLKDTPLTLYYVGREQQLLFIIAKIEELENNELMESEAKNKLPSQYEDEPNEPEYTFGDG